MNGLACFLETQEPFGHGLKVKRIEPILLKKAAEQIQGDPRAMDFEQVEILQARVAKAIRDGEGNMLSPRDLTEACDVFFHQPRLLTIDDTVADGLLTRVAALKHRSAFLSILDTYLDSFSSYDPAVTGLAARLKPLFEVWPWRETDRWPEWERTFSLLDPTRAPSAIANAVLSSTRPLAEVLAGTGLNTNGRRLGGLAETAFSYACAQVAALAGEAAEPAQVRLVEWATLDDKPLAYPKAWVAFARGLCEPWRKTEPKRNHKTFILEAALKFGGDPRLNEASWRPVSLEAPEIYDVIVRWLTRASIAQFFDIVSQTMNSPDEKRMWRERREFWTDFLDKGHITGAWVAFGSDGAERAQKAARNAQDKELSMFGRLRSGRGRTPQHAALLMTIGELTIVDWSHNGRWNVWDRKEDAKPSLFAGDYDPKALANPREDRHGSHDYHGHWRSHLRNLIYQLTGRLP